MSLYAEACFFCQQCAEMALKAFLYRQGRRDFRLHSIQALLNECSSYNEEFQKILRLGRMLDRFYLTTRYPDAVLDVLPYETVDEQDAGEALKAARHILDFVKSSLEKSS